MPRISLAFATICCVFFVSDLAADVLNLSASRDNTLYEDSSGSLSNGVGEHLFAGRTFQGSGFSIRRGLLFFDLNAIAPGSTINSVSLSMTMNRTLAGAFDVSLHRLNADWGEGASDAPGEEGSGGMAQNGDATWIHTFSPGSFWSTAGGDYAAGASATTSVGGVGTYFWSSGQMLADVQDWVDNGSNSGWILIGDESIAGTAKRFSSRENAVGGPLLTIDFTPIPEPASLSLLGLLAASALFVRRRRK